MKISLLAPLVGLTLMTFGPLYAQSSATVAPATTPASGVPAEREEATGTISELTPDRSLVLHTGTGDGEPLVFRFAPAVTYVDPDGKIVEAAGLRKNLRVRVSYMKAEGDNIIDKVTILE